MAKDNKFIELQLFQVIWYFYLTECRFQLIVYYIELSMLLLMKVPLQEKQTKYIRIHSKNVWNREWILMDLLQLWSVGPMLSVDKVLWWQLLLEKTVEQVRTLNSFSLKMMMINKLKLPYKLNWKNWHHKLVDLVFLLPFSFL